MSTLGEWLRAGAPDVGNHLWQTTVFVAAIWLLTFLMRKSQARVRYALWIAASVKFLLPFSLLIALGGLLPKPQQLPAPTIIEVANFAGQPFSRPTISIPTPVRDTQKLRERFPNDVSVASAAIWLCGSFSVLGVWTRRWLRVVAIRRRATPIREGREVEIMRNLELSGPADTAALRLASIPIVLIQGLMEPGVFGIFRPILLWPEGLSARLNDQQLEAIFAHELSHARRHDNLTALLQMLVEAVFWFHPAVWWIERQMIDERERACDEAVVAIFGSAEVYADGILTACRFCVEAPLPCISGISGADLNQRIVSLMTLRIRRLGALDKIALASLAVIGLTAPVALGLTRLTPLYDQILHATGPLPSFEVATIRPSKRPLPPPPGEQVIRERVEILPAAGSGMQTSDRIQFVGQAELLIAWAYNLPAGSERSRIIGSPAWASNEENSYEVQAKIESSILAAMQSKTGAQQREEVQLMEQSLLAERFKLKAHVETRQMPTFALVVARGGPKLTSTKNREINKLAAVSRGEETEMTATSVTIDQLARFLSEGEIGGHPIVDQTGLKGTYDFTLKWSSQQSAAGQENRADAPAFFTAIREQLGLKLVPSKGRVEVIVVDHIERPTEN